MQLVAPQKFLGPRAFLAAVLTLNTTIMLAIDMYVPALPGMLEEFGTTASFLNLTMFMFMFVSAFAVLIAGPLSDKFGRKPITVFSCAIFTISSLGGALSGSVLVLTVFRMGQAIGFGMVMTTATAFVKDAYADEDLKYAMSLLQSLIIVGPILAPFLGTSFLVLGGWRAIFYALTVIGIIDLVLALLMTETLRPEQRLASGVGPALRDMVTRTGELLSQRSFTAMALFMGLAGLTFMGYIAVCSYILLDDFGVSYLGYSIIYGATCLIGIIAPFVYLRLSKFMSIRAVTVLCVVLAVIGSALMLTIGPMSPGLFFIAFAVFALMEGIVRPHAFVVLLEQPPEQVGTASAFANFSYTIMGAIGTIIMTLPWASYVGGLGLVMSVCTVLMFLLFVWGLRK